MQRVVHSVRAARMRLQARALLRRPGRPQRGAPSPATSVHAFLLAACGGLVPVSLGSPALTALGGCACTHRSISRPISLPSPPHAGVGGRRGVSGFAGVSARGSRRAGRRRGEVPPRAYRRVARLRTPPPMHGDARGDNRPIYGPAAPGGMGRLQGKEAAAVLPNSKSAPPRSIIPAFAAEQLVPEDGDRLACDPSRSGSVWHANTTKKGGA